MKICFPARKHNGENYATLDEMMGLIGREPHGSWLAGTNMLWHGGIHISTVSAPGSILNGDAAVPLQCMAGGEVVAWRLNQDYLTSTYNHQTLKYSSTFVLVKSTCKPDPDKTNSWLDFYSLYLGLAPLSAFTKNKCYKALKTVSKRKASAYESSAQADQVADAPQREGTLAKDSRVIILQEAQFLNKDETHNVVAQPFGLAKVLDSEGKAGDKTFWVTLLPQYMAEDGEQYAHLPVWMQQAVAQGTFDAVVKPATALELAAGDAVGFLAKDIDPADRGTVDTSYFSHVEVLCADPRMPDFLNNPAGIKTGAKYIRILSGKSLYSKRGEGEDSTFTAMSCVIVKDSGEILPVDKCHPLKDKQGKTWYEIRAGSWMSQDDVELLHQYDLKELGFTALEEESTADMTKSLHEGWMKSAFSWLSEQVRPEKGIQQRQVSGYYKKAMKNIDTDGNGQLSGEELFHAVHHPEMEVRNIAARMIVKHDSEWFGGSQHHKWAVYLQNYDRLRLDYTKKWLDDMEWMSHVAPFNEDKPVWHMHPVMFLDALAPMTGLINVEEFLKEYEKLHVSFALGTPLLTQNARNNLKKIVNRVNKFYDDSSKYKPNLYKISYMLATTRHETYHFTSGEYFSEKPEVGSVSYFNKYDPILASEKNKRDTAMRFGNTNEGDGFRYRGRGCVHLTWKNNYKKAGDEIGFDLVSSPDLAADFTYAVPIMIWGMEDGVFTGRSLKNYINDSKVSYTDARRVINGTDKASLIASYADKFQSILEKTSNVPKDF